VRRWNNEDIDVIYVLLAVKRCNLELDLYSNSILVAFSSFYVVLNFTIFLYWMLICVYFVRYS